MFHCICVCSFLWTNVSELGLGLLVVGDQRRERLVRVFISEKAVVEVSAREAVVTFTNAFVCRILLPSLYTIVAPIL